MFVDRALPGPAVGAHSTPRPSAGFGLQDPKTKKEHREKEGKWRKEWGRGEGEEGKGQVPYWT